MTPIVLNRRNIPIDSSPQTAAATRGWLSDWMEFAGLTAWDTLWQCDECSCLFIPQTDLPRVYLDRWVHAGFETHHCASCHRLPRVVPAGAGSVLWSFHDIRNGWLAGAPVGFNGTSPICDRCTEPACLVVVLPPQDDQVPVVAWLCPHHAPVPVPPSALGELSGPQESSLLTDLLAQQTTAVALLGEDAYRAWQR